MNYIELLTKDEKSSLCEIITGKEFKELFKRNEPQFLKIQKGFRAKSLTERQALLVAKTNIDKPFITGFANTMVEYWLKEIQDNVCELEGEGLSHGAALATTMLDSRFSNNVELYFKLTESALDESARSILCDMMKIIESQRKKDADMSNLIKTIKEDNNRLSDQAKKAQNGIDVIKADYAERIQKIEQDKEQLVSRLEEAQAKISELQVIPNVITSNVTDQLEQYDDTNSTYLPSVQSDEITSLCSLGLDNSGQKWLIRHADLDHKGHYNIFCQNKDILPCFTNRKRIFYKDGPSDDNFYGIWTWSALPNEKDPSKDYISSRFNNKLDAIEVVTVSEVLNLDKLTNLLKKGIEYTLHSGRIMFAYYMSNGQYTGILCNSKELETVNGKTVISKMCMTVPVYEFSDNDIIRLDSGLLFYRNAFAGVPKKQIYLKSPLDIVRDTVLSSISWNAYKTREIIHSEYILFKNFIGSIPVNDITYEIAEKCHCSVPAAKKLLDEFLNTVRKYIDGDSIEDAVICSAISANVELQEKTKALIRKDWESENESLLAEARQKLDLVHAELKSATEKLSETQKTLAKTQTEDQRLSGIIAQKEKLAEDVETAVAERIQKARENAADFIANMAFVSGKQVQAAETAKHVSIDYTSEHDMATYRVYPEDENLDELEVHHSWKDVIDTAVYELADAGVAEQYRSGLAAFLCAAYIEKQPIFLVGPNAIDIAQAFSSAVTAYKHGVLCCMGDNIIQSVEKIGVDDEDIVIINNLIASGWINRLPEVISKKDIFYIATHPYAEDIQVEPKSLYGFMLPLFTEILVDRNATGKHFGGYFSDDFKLYSAKKNTNRLAALSKFAISSLVKSQINSLWSTMHGIYPTATTDDDFLFCIFPIAYASMEIDELAESIADSQKGITISARLKHNLQYILGEISNGKE